MRRHCRLNCICILTLICIGVAPAFALGPAPYIGASLQVNNPTGKFSGEDVTKEEGGARTAVGAEIDAGLNLSNASVYVGYRFGKHDAEGTLETPFGDAKTSGEWKINRWVAGARFQLLPAVVPVSPMIGGGVTLGATNLQGEGEAGGISVNAAEDSKSTMGWFLEAGAIIKTSGAFSIVGSAQYHQFDAEYETELYDGTVKISFITLNAGLRFTLI